MTSGFSGEMMKEITKISIHPLTKMSLIVEVNMALSSVKQGRGFQKANKGKSKDTFPTFRGKLSSPTESRFLKVSNITSTYKALWAGSRHSHSSGENWTATSFNVNCDLKLKKKNFTKAMRRVPISIQNE